MKKLAGILLLTAAVILTAGCISTADPIVGTWELTEPLQYDDYSFTYSLKFNEDGTGTEVASYSDEPRDSIYNLVWEKTGENTYRYEAFDAFILSEDGKFMTDWAGYTYALAEGEEIIGGIWTETAVDEDGERFTYVFEEGGECIRTIYSDGEEPQIASFMWSMEDENQIIIWMYETYTINDDGIMTTSVDETVTFTDVDGVWIETPQVGPRTTTFQFFDDGSCIQTNYVGDTDEVYVMYYLYWEEEEDGKSGVLKQRYAFDMTLEEDGTLVDMWYGDVLAKVTE